ncbi:MAG: sensor histidine kinase [Hyphomicrobiales bacterium]
MELRSLESVDDEELCRREAIGAFAHEVRTPLTTIRMVMELASRDGGDGRLTLDRELADMLSSSVDDLQALADALHETSRLERNKLVLSQGPCDLAFALDRANELLAPRVRVDGQLPTGIVGPWDGERLMRALAGFAESANRIGEGSGVVSLEHGREPGHTWLRLASGQPGPEPRPLSADAGFGFFRARRYVLAMNGRVAWHRTDRHFAVHVTLPLSP